MREGPSPPKLRSSARPVSLAVLAVANLGFVFLFQWYIIARLGADLATDALFIAMIVPHLVLAVTGASLAGVLVPLFSAREERLARAAWTVIHAVGGAATALAVLLFATVPVWAGILAPGFDAATTELVADLVRIQLLAVPFSAVAAVLWAMAYARHRFYWAESAPLLSVAVGLMALVWVLPRFGVMGAAWTIVLRSVLQATVLIPLAGTYRRPDWQGDVLHEGLRRLRPLLLGTTYYKSDELVDRVLASMAPGGLLTLLYLAQRLWGAAHSVLSKALVAPVTPRLARLAAGGEWVAYRRLLRQRILELSALLFGGSALVLVAGEWGLEFLFRGTAVGPSEVRMIWWLLLALLGMWVGGGLGELLSAAFYAKGDTTTPTRIGVLGFTLGIGLKVGGFFLWGVVGIALGTSGYYLFNMILLFFFLSRDLRRRERAGPLVGAVP